jgi:Rieske 2Fe-2S family protein
MASATPLSARNGPVASSSKSSNGGAESRPHRHFPPRREGWTLPQPYFTDPEFYRADLDRIWRRGWLFAGHSCELASTGEYFLVEVDVDSVIVIRGENGALHAVHNVCRHRGSLLCAEPCGHVAKLVCPYHQWAYDFDGRLLAWRGMQADLKKEDFALRTVHVHEVEGLIFVSLAAEPLPFGDARECLAALARPQGFQRARVAKSVDYLVKANWKVVWENNRECYHCNVNHPQYIKANFDHFNTDDVTPRIREEIAAVTSRNESRWSAAGLASARTETGMTKFPDAERGIWFSANRTPLVDGWVSETMDGQRVAPLMGEYRDEDVGTLRLRALPNFWNHSSCDHAVSTRLLPAGPQLTAIRVWWLVDAQAIEGRDYDLAKLLPFWQLTSEQDWVICERQQKGINSSAYTPGPYSTFKEYNVDGFVRWYLDMLGKDA